MLYDFFAMRQKPEIAVSADAISEYDVSELANSALEAKIVAPSAEFAPSAGSPFKVVGGGTAAGFSHRTAAGASVKPRRLPFVLRGLMKSPPFAIIEDARGETHIKARGDFIQGAQIIAVNSNSVVFKDSSGTHELTVEENR
jgi:hypothetical protein